MRSLLKKKSEAAHVVMPHWHPDFRNVSRLPDIKVVRTAFFVNGAAISILLALSILLGTREWQVRVIKRQVTEWQAQIDKDKKNNDQSVALYRKFQAEEARLSEVNAFIKSKPAVSELIFHFGRTLPKNIALDSFNLGSGGLGLRGTVRGAPEQATGYAGVYIDQLKNDPFIAERFEDVTTKGLTRNPANNRVIMELHLKLRTTPLKGAK